MFEFDGGLRQAQRLWRLLPLPVRRTFGRAAIRWTAPRAGSPPPRAPGAPVTVAGLFSNACGIGEGARLCAAMLTRLGYPVITADLTSHYAAVNLEPPAASPIPDAPGGALILHLNPPLTAPSLLLLGRARTAGRRIIGYWAWEQPEIPAFWRRDLSFLHEIWTPSEFCAEAVRPFTTKPVRVAPHPVPIPTVAPLGRADFGLPDKTFIVFAMLHFGSGFERKNPLAAIRAFRQAFGDRDDALLLLKITKDADLPWAEQALREATDGARNIRVMERTLPREELNALIAACDVLLSLHRAEGFGLGLAEAMRLGKPVAATGWSGNMTFMDEVAAAPIPVRLIPAEDRQGTYDRRHVWADPDVAAAAALLVRLQSDRDFAARMGAAAMAAAEARLGPSAYAAAVAAALPPPPAALCAQGLE
jgi:glycosyltransferase involved in cell wall biosynthesis